MTTTPHPDRADSVAEAAREGYAAPRSPLAAEDGLVDVTKSSSSGWWELSMVFNSDRGSNANPTYDINPANFVCDN